MFRRLYRITWLATLCLQVSAALGQTLSSAATTQPCDKDCRQLQIDALFKKLDEAEIKQRLAAADAQYSQAIQTAVTAHWVRPSSLIKAPCIIHITQLPGGEVINAEADVSCPYDAQGRKAAEDAVRHASPLPYKGFENVFRRRIDFTFHA